MGQHKKRRNPPLSKLDKAIYDFLCLLMLVIIVSVVPLSDMPALWLATREHTILAVSRHTSTLLELPVPLYLSISAEAAIGWRRSARIPIFGNPNIKYGKYPWSDVYPLFYKNKPKKHLRPMERELKKSAKILWSIGLILCLLLLPFGLFGRDCLTKDDRIITYDCLNRVVLTYDTAEVSFVRLNCFYSSSRYTTTANYSIILTMSDGEKFQFINEEFALDMDLLSTIGVMQEIKDSMPPDCVTYEGLEDLEDVIDSLALTPEEETALRRLFTPN